jgi:hypothetical protein
VKFIKSYNELINESTRFKHFSNVLDTVEDLVIDFKDEGGEVVFGVMPTGDYNYHNFDEALDDVSIKMAAIGKKSVYVKLDVQGIIKLSNGKLNDGSLELLIETLKSVYNYLLNEDLVVSGFWTKQLVIKDRSDYGKNNFFRFESIDQLIDDILGKNQIFVKYLLDARIVFSGQPILEESVNVSDSDIEDIKDILDDFNSEHHDEGRTHIDAELNFKHIIISDKTETYSGFSFKEIVPTILRLMSRFEINSIRLGIVFIYNYKRDFQTFSKDQLLSMLDDDDLEDKISNVSINLENF